VTFIDNDRFYATAASGKKTWLVEGSLSTQALTAVREDAECPSLSPDGSRVAIKTRDGLPAGQWRIAVFDLKTHTSVRLSERRSVDDQVEWLDDSRVIYGLPRQGEGASNTDVWVAAADGSGSPQLFIPDAWSPAVIR
jgi:Tol biopolymer transport system component